MVMLILKNLKIFRDQKFIPNKNELLVDLEPYKVDIKMSSNYQPQTAIESTIIESSLRRYNRPEQADLFKQFNEIGNALENVNSRYTTPLKDLTTRTASKEQVNVLIDYAGKRGGVLAGKPIVYGTSSTKLQTEGFREPGDIDLQLFLKSGNAEESVEKLVKRLNEVAPSKDFEVMTTKESPLTIINKKTRETVADIHSVDSDLIADEVPMRSFGRNIVQPVKKYEDIYTSRLSAEGQAKGSSIFSLNEKFNEIGFSPKSGREKDIDDYFNIQRQLAKNLGTEEDSFAQKLTGKTNVKKSQDVLKQIDELEARYPKDKILKFEDDMKLRKQPVDDIKLKKQNQLDDVKRLFAEQKYKQKVVSGALSNPLRIILDKFTGSKKYNSAVSGSYKYSPKELYKPSGYSSQSLKSASYKSASFGSASYKPASYDTYKPSSYVSPDYKPSKYVPYDYKPYEPSKYKPYDYNKYNPIQYPGFGIPGAAFPNLGQGNQGFKQKGRYGFVIKDRKLKKLYKEIGL